MRAARVGHSCLPDFERDWMMATSGMRGNENWAQMPDVRCEELGRDDRL